MTTIRRWHRGVLAGVLLALAALAGCQTYYGGGTYPTPRYLEHAPQYIPPSPPYPFPREQATMAAIAAQPEPGAPVGLPPRVPAGPPGPAVPPGPAGPPGPAVPPPGP